ncbi:hypothetical protein MMC11_000925 [Xylographa trunciseda]|nr:hypothetical protein [Xylographa trunciseda]
MVRIKHRYLLVHILYPDASPSFLPTPSKASPPLPPILHFRQPTPDDLTPQLLLRAIREQVALLYGDYGAGVTAAGLNGTPSVFLPLPSFILHHAMWAFHSWLVKYLSAATSTFILRCPRAHYQLVWASLTYMTHLPAFKPASGHSFHKAQPCALRVVRVSGTVRKAEEEAVRRARADILRARRGGGPALEGMLGVEGEGREEEGGIVDEDGEEEKEEEEEDEGDEEE